MAADVVKLKNGTKVKTVEGSSVVVKTRAASLSTGPR
jgi:hypothetical protein